MLGILSRQINDFMLLIGGDSLKARIVGGSFWSIVGTGVSQFLGLVVTISCARLLGQEIYGELGIILTTVELFTTVATVGLGVTATKHIAEYRKSEPEKAGSIIGMSYLISISAGIVIALALYIASSFLASVVLNSPNLALPLSIASIIMLFVSINGYQISVLMGFECFGKLAQLNIIRGVVSLPVVLIGSIAGGLIGTIVAYSIMSIINYSLHNNAVKKACEANNIIIVTRFDRKYLPVLINYSIPVFVAGLSFTPASWYSNALLASSSGYSQYGIFAAAFQWQIVILFFSTAVSNIGLPILSSVLPEKNYEKYYNLLKVNFFLTTGSSLVIALPLAFASYFIMSLYGEEFKAGASVLTIICFASVLSAANITVGHAIWSLNAAKAGMFLALFRGISLVVAAYYLVPMGAMGLALAYLVMGILQTIIQYPFVWSLLNKYRIACRPV
jgi:O-antigen/teichoic acid export membrane protein